MGGAFMRREWYLSYLFDCGFWGQFPSHLTIYATQPRFQAKVRHVMEIIINSLYSDLDIFLWKLVSNSADTFNKNIFLSITDDGKSASLPP